MQAKPLADRLTQAGSQAGAEQEPMLGQERLDAWCRVVTGGDESLLRKRLAWDGLDVNTARSALVVQPAVDGEAMPVWAIVLDEAVRYSSTFPTSSQDLGQMRRFIDEKAPLPFEDLLAPFVLVARQRLRRSAGVTYSLLLDECHAALERSLLEALAALSAQTFHSEFYLFRAQHQPSLASMFALVQHDADRTLYQEFVRRMEQGGLVLLLMEYAALARLLGLITQLWVEANTLFLQRLQADGPDIRRSFGIDSEHYSISALQPALSDPHDGRNSVIGMTFSSGRRLIYKPRSVGIEAVYQSLQRWLNDEGVPLQFRVLTVINRDSHGWVEYVEHAASVSREDVQHYYQRAGMQLCLVYLLGGTDFHSENIIASGEHPVLVDMEMLLCHRVKDHPAQSRIDGPEAVALAYEQLTQSVLSTGLLPGWTGEHDGEGSLDMSGLGGVETRAIPLEVRKWEGINTDRMVLGRGPVAREPEQNLVMFDGQAARVETYCDEVSDGFKVMYRFLLDRKAALLAREGPFSAFADQPVRYLHRATRAYAAFHRSLLNPKYLRDGADRGIQIDLLNRELLAERERPQTWPLLAAERRAIEQADIPHFTARADSADLILPTGETISQFFKEPSCDQVFCRIAGLSEEDLACQVGFIEGSLRSQAAYGGAASVSTEESAAGAIKPLSTSDLVAGALAIADEIRVRAICAMDGSAIWIGPQYVDEKDRVRFEPLDVDLYDGASGVALFLSAVAAMTGCRYSRALAVGAVQSVCRMLTAGGENLADRLGIGGGAGLGGVVYSLLRISHLLNDEELLDNARLAAGLITPERIGADRSLDVIDGAAGALLGLIALYEVSRDGQVLDRAVICGEHLLSVRAVGTSGYRSWPSEDGLFLAGFSHGAAGIAYAMLRLYKQTKDQRLLDTARDGMAYENSLLDRVSGNWPNLLAKDGPNSVMQWCHGAPGIGLSRLAVLPILPPGEVQADIDIALASTERLSVGATDHLCCGNLGRIDFLLTAGTRLGRPRLVERAWQQAAVVVSRGKKAGSFALDPLLPRSVFSPGLFQGIAGIGYELLRLAFPDRLPSVLLWEHES